MRTSRTISTISYNTFSFLDDKLSDLVSRNIISYYCYIEHLPEADEKKKHIHLLIVPNGTIDTDSLRTYFNEIVPTNEKPLGCMPFRASKFADWYLYSIHDKRYLAQKGQARQYSYSAEEFIFSSFEYHNELLHEIDYSKLNRFDKLVESVENGLTFGQYLLNNYVPIQQISGYKIAFEALTRELVRSSPSHTPADKVDNVSVSLLKYKKAPVISAFVNDDDNPF